MSEIVYLSQPQIVNIKKWLADNTGYVGVGKRTNITSDIQLLAYQKADCASPELRQFAKKTGSMTLVSVSNGGLNFID